MRKRVLVGVVLSALCLSLGGAQAQISEPIEVEVARIIDGDTIEISTGEKVRYIGIDTPEKGDLYYREAIEANANLVENKIVRLEFDKQQKDSWNRLLVYVFVGDTFVNAELVRQGFALATVYPPNVKHAGLFAKLQEEAKRNIRGFWKDIPKPIARPTAKWDFEIIAGSIEGDPDPEDEWIMIQNVSSKAYNLSRWSIADDDFHKFYIEERIILFPGEILIIANTEETNTPFRRYTYCINYSKYWITNTFDILSLFNQDDELVLESEVR